MNLAALLLSALHAATPAPAGAVASPVSPASLRWPVPSVSAVLDSGLLVQTGDTLRGVTVRGTCETLLSGLWDGRRFRLNARSLRGGKTVPGRLEFLYPDSLEVRFEGASPCAGDTARLWGLCEKVPTALDAIAVPATDSLAQGLGSRRFLARSPNEPGRPYRELRATALDRLRERFARFELEVPDTLNEMVQLVDMEGETLDIPVRNHRLLPPDSFPTLPALPATVARATPRAATGLSYLQADRRMLGLKILADSGLGGWSLQQPTFSHSSIHIRGTVALVSPEGRTTLQIRSNAAEMDDEFPVPSSLVAPSESLCREAAQRSLEPWLAEMVLWLRSRTDTTGPLPPLPRYPFPTALPVGDTLHDGSRLCVGSLAVPWKSERDSGTTVYDIPFLVSREDAGYRPWTSILQAFDGIDTAQSGKLRGVPDLGQLFSRLSRWQESRSLYDLRDLSPAWRRVPTSSPASLLRLCLEPARGQGSGCLELDTLGTIRADARLERLPGWRGCLGLACPDPDTAKLLGKATDLLERLWDAECTRMRYDSAHSTELGQLYYNEPSLPWSTLVKLLPGTAKDARPQWQGSICLIAGPNHGCLVLGGDGSWRGEGLFSKAKGRFEGEVRIDATTPAAIPAEPPAVKSKPRSRKR